MPKEDLVKIIPKPKPKTPASVYFLFWFSFALVIVLLGLSFFLKYETIILKAEKDKLGSQLIVSQEQKNKEEELSVISEQINDFPIIFSKHQNFSKIFSFLKDICHPKVQFTDLDLVADDYKISLFGETENFKTLGEQIVILERSEKISDLQISNISLSKEGKVSFNLSFYFSKDLVKK